MSPSEIATIKNFMLSFSLSNPTFVSPTVTQIIQKLNFASITNLKTKEGSYTPHNDYQYIWQSIPAAQAPNFIFIQTPTALNITVTITGGVQLCNAVPVNKVFMLCLPPGITVESIYLEGRAVHAAMVAQDVEAQYFCLMAQAVF